MLARKGSRTIRHAADRDMAVSDLGEVIVEAIRHGTYLKVTAIHVASGTEVSAVGPVHEPKAVERLAIAKLRRRLGAS